MTVKAILSTKGTEVTTIEPTVTLEAAIAALAERRIGALVVLGPERRMIGILSERDIVRALAEQGAAALKQPLAQVMTRKVSTCTQAETVSAAEGQWLLAMALAVQKAQSTGPRLREAADRDGTSYRV